MEAFAAVQKPRSEPLATLRRRMRASRLIIGGSAAGMVAMIGAVLIAAFITSRSTDSPAADLLTLPGQQWAFASPVTPGHPQSWGEEELFNESAHSVVLRSVTIIDPSAGFHVLGVRIATVRIANISTSPGYPARGLRRLVAVRGAIIPPLHGGRPDRISQTPEIIIGYRVDAGVARAGFRGLIVTYVYEGHTRTYPIITSFTACPTSPTKTVIQTSNYCRANQYSFAAN